MSAVVSCRACPDYEPENVRTALQACLDDLGGLEAFVRPGDRVLIKPNLLMPAKPEQAITTHPELVRAVIRAVRAAGGLPVLGDSPAASPLELTARRAGVQAVAREERVPLADMGPTLHTASPRAVGKRGYDVASAALEADVLINLPKLKTHALTHVTIAQKNLFGLIPGLRKGRWHMAAQAPEHFAGLLADLYAAVLDHPGGPRLLHIVDGVLCLEGNGPGTGGTPRHLGALLASSDGVAVDRVACELAGIDPARAPLLRQSGELGLGQAHLEAIELRGQALEELRGEPFAAPESHGASPSLQAALWSSARVRNITIERPLVHREPCVGCGQCVRICPAEALRLEPGSGVARVDYSTCIRCYCCAEICPHAAIDKSATPLLGRALVHPWLLPALLGAAGIALVALLVSLATGLG